MTTVAAILLSMYRSCVTQFTALLYRLWRTGSKMQVPVLLFLFSFYPGFWHFFSERWEF